MQWRIFLRGCVRPSVRLSVCRSVHPLVGSSVGLSVGPSLCPVFFFSSDYRGWREREMKGRIVEQFFCFWSFSGVLWPFPGALPAIFRIESVTFFLHCSSIATPHTRKRNSYNITVLMLIYSLGVNQRSHQLSKNERYGVFGYLLTLTIDFVYLKP